MISIICSDLNHVFLIPKDYDVSQKAHHIVENVRMRLRRRWVEWASEAKEHNGKPSTKEINRMVLYDEDALACMLTSTKGNVTQERAAWSAVEGLFASYAVSRCVAFLLAWIDVRTCAWCRGMVCPYAWVRPPFLGSKDDGSDQNEKAMQDSHSKGEVDEMWRYAKCHPGLKAAIVRPPLLPIVLLRVLDRRCRFESCIPI